MKHAERDARTEATRKMLQAAGLPLPLEPRVLEQDEFYRSSAYERVKDNIDKLIPNPLTSDFLNAGKTRLKTSISNQLSELYAHLRLKIQKREGPEQNDAGCCVIS